MPASFIVSHLRIYRKSQKWEVRYEFQNNLPSATTRKPTSKSTSRTTNRRKRNNIKIAEACSGLGCLFVFFVILLICMFWNKKPEN